MSLMGTLAKVAIGVIVAKGVGSLMQKGGSGGGGLDTIFGRGASGSAGGSGAQLPGGLDDLMGEILGGKRTAGSGSARAESTEAGTGGFGLPGGGGLGDLLDSLTGGGAGSRQAGGGGLDDLIGSLGGLLGGDTGRKPGVNTAGGGGLGDLLGGLLGGVLAGSAGGAGSGFGKLLNQSLSNRGEPETPPTAEQDAVAGLMLSAMIQAAKSDGRIDAAEQKKLIGNLGDATEAERAFVQQELDAPVDIQRLVTQVPKGLAPQIYTMSLMAIDLDSPAEAQYLDRLAQGLGLSATEVNALHGKLGAPALYG